MTASARRRATYDDLLAVGPHLVAELVDGELHVHPRPAGPHTLVASGLGGELHGPFQRGRGGPGGWILLDEPELHLGDDVLVPDLAGWRRERMPQVAQTAHFTLAPDWVCEVLSPATRRFDRIEKLRLYAQARVEHAWLLDPLERSLEVFRLIAGAWTLLSGFSEDERVRAAPFEAFELELGALWADIAPASPAPG